MYYPTKEYILSHPIRHKREVVVCFKKWKEKNKIRKYQQIKWLLHQLAKIYNVPISVKFDKNQLPHYNTQTKIISLKNNSIITALHEFGHHLYGPSEAKACRWSIWLFLKIFPKALIHLSWEGHQLKKR